MLELEAVRTEGSAKGRTLRKASATYAKCHFELRSLFSLLNSAWLVLRLRLWGSTPPPPNIGESKVTVKSYIITVVYEN